jgi:hypothetical protein
MKVNRSCIELKAWETHVKSCKMNMLAVCANGVWLTQSIAAVAESEVRGCKQAIYCDSYDEIWNVQVA